MSTTITPTEQNIDINVTNDVIDINVTNSVVDVNATAQDININVAGAYPLPNSVFSVFGRVGDVVAAEGDYTLTQLGDVTITNPITDNILKYNGTSWVNGVNTGGTVTSVAVSRSGDALAITGSPITSSGTINIGFAGTGAQYIKGDGTLATFPTTIAQAQNLITEVYNRTGATLTKGTIVYINGGQGNLPTVTKALATGDSTSAQTYGVVQSDITNMNNGFVVVAGRLLDIDTQAYTEGTQLYLSATTAGAWTSTKQYAPNHLVYIGIVVRAHPTQGVVEIKIQNGYEMDELHNVAAQNPDNNDILQYKTATSLWTKVAGTTSNIAEGSNLYYTDARSRAALSASSPLSYNNTTGAFSISQANTTTNGFLSSTDWNTFNSKQAAGNYITSLTGEATASGPGAASVTLSTSAVTGKLLTGLNLTGGGSIAATDSILAAFGKVQNQISGMVGGVTFQGTWNASTNTPTLTSSVGTKGYYYIVDVAGSTNLNGITDWKVGDWAIYNGTTWDKVDNTDAVSSVNGFTGAVSLTTSNIAEGTNLYYTEGRVSANTDVAANTAARHNAVTLGTANGLSLSTQVLSLALASGSTTGALSSTDWTTFNNKQNALTNPVTGTGTTNYLPKFTGTSTLGDSNLINDASGNLGLGVTPSAWDWVAFQTQRASINGGANDRVETSYNYVRNSSANKYIANDFATRYIQISGTHSWDVAASGTAGNTFSFTQAMSLNTSGNLNVLGSVTANSFIKSGGTSAQILAADGSVITAGTNITISGGTISSSGGGGGGMAIGGTITSATEGSVLFAGASGVLAQDNANFFWDDTNNRLGLGSTTLGSTLQINGNAAIGYSASTAAPTNGLAVSGESIFSKKSASNLVSSVSIGDTILYPTGANRAKLAIGNTSDTSEILIGQSTGNALYIGWQYNATAANAYGLIETYSNSNNIVIQSGNGRIGMGTTTIGSKLQVNGNAAIGYSASTAAPTNGLAVSGNVAIGTNSSSVPLLVSSTATVVQTITSNNTGGTQLYLVNTSTGGDTFRLFSTGQSNGEGAGHLLIAPITGAGRFIMQGSGNIGINTTTVGSRLQVNGNAAIGYSSSTAAPTNGLAVAGNATIGGFVGIGVAATTAYVLRISSNVTGGSSARGIVLDNTIQSDVTNTMVGVGIAMNTVAASFTLGNFYNFYVAQGTKGAGSTITNQYGYFVDASFVAATNNYAFKSSVPSGANRWGLHFDGTASNYLEGSIGVGTQTIGSKLQVNGNAAIGYSASTAAPTNGLAVSGNVGIGVTSTTWKAEIFGGNANTLKLNNNNSQFVQLMFERNSVANSGGDILLDGTNGTFSFRALATHGLVFATSLTAGAVTERGRFTNTGGLTLTTGANVSAIAQTGYSLTGSNAQSLLSLAGTWNTTGNPTAILLNITNTASGSTADLMELQVGGVSQFLVSKAGNTEMTGSIKTGAPSGGTAQPWKLGTVYTGTCVPTTFGEFGTWFTGTVIEIEVNGTTYKVPAIIDNYC